MSEQGKANILIVDDLADNRLVLETILQDLGQNIVSVRSGEEALAQVLRREFAVILLDINMPGMDGLETAAFIRRRKKSSHTPIIFITAYADAMHTEQGYALGAVDYVFTPVAPQILRTKVQVFVDLHLMTQQARQQADERVALAREQAARAAAEDATRRMAFLADASNLLASTLDFDATLRALALHAVPMLADLAWARRVDEQGRLGPAELAWAQPDGKIRGLRDDVGTEPLPCIADATARCLKTGCPVHVTDAGPWPAFAATTQAKMNGSLTARPTDGNIRSVIGLPLMARGRTLGVLKLLLGPSGRSHDASDLALAADLAARAATALDNARLYQNIQQEDERKNQFLAMLAHELRNPLAPIRNAVEVLKIVGAPDPSQLQARDVIDRQVTHMARLVDDLLDMSRLARGKILLQRQRLDLVQVVKETLEDYQGQLDRGRLRLEVHLSDVPLYVDGDVTRLAQVLGNLLSNAIKFTDPCGAVTVGLTSEKDALRAVLTVRDSGIGMEPAMLERVFDIFSQADSSLDRSRGGLGLGLALVRGLVELHGGEVRAASPGLGGGTEITISLPLVLAAPTPQASKQDHKCNGEPRRVLVIEDNPDTAETMRLLFSMNGHQVKVATAGKAGVATAQSFHPEIILCDIGLPGGMDGYAVARAIRGDPALSPTQLIALSGYGQEEDRRRSQEAGFDAHFIKPINFTDLCLLLNGTPAP